jgi:divalent metal cation (Fe/Co/Zn/Cd) transporter
MAGYESIQRLLHPRPVEYLWAVMVASVVGFLGNEAVAAFRIQVGKEIGSAALVAKSSRFRVAPSIVPLTSLLMRVQFFHKSVLGGIP